MYPVNFIGKPPTINLKDGIEGDGKYCCEYYYKCNRSCYQNRYECNFPSASLSSIFSISFDSHNFLIINYLWYFVLFLIENDRYICSTSISLKIWWLNVIFWKWYFIFKIFFNHSIWSTNNESNIVSINFICKMFRI